MITNTLSFDLYKLEHQTSIVLINYINQIMMNNKYLLIHSKLIECSKKRKSCLKTYNKDNKDNKNNKKVKFTLSPSVDKSTINIKKVQETLYPYNNYNPTSSYVSLKDDKSLLQIREESKRLIKLPDICRIIELLIPNLTFSSPFKPNETSETYKIIEVCYKLDLKSSLVKTVNIRDQSITFFSIDELCEQTNFEVSSPISNLSVLQEIYHLYKLYLNTDQDYINKINNFVNVIKNQSIERSKIILTDSYLQIALALVRAGLPSIQIIILEENKLQALYLKIISNIFTPKVYIFWVEEYNNFGGVRGFITNNVFGLSKLFSPLFLKRIEFAWLDLPESDVNEILKKLKNLKLLISRKNEVLNSNL